MVRRAVRIEPHSLIVLAVTRNEEREAVSGGAKCAAGTHGGPIVTLNKTRHRKRLGKLWAGAAERSLRAPHKTPHRTLK